jgi:ATP-dependent helicase YprA (DUF1998 family)
VNREQYLKLARRGVTLHRKTDGRKARFRLDEGNGSQLGVTTAGDNPTDGHYITPPNYPRSGLWWAPEELDEHFNIEEPHD